MVTQSIKNGWLDDDCHLIHVGGSTPGTGCEVCSGQEEVCDNCSRPQDIW